MAEDTTASAGTPATGLADQLPATMQDGIAQARSAAAPLIARAKQFAKERPFATATLAGVLGVALINTLRGR